jgi:filamentous hemagglutinin family protein
MIGSTFNLGFHMVTKKEQALLNDASKAANLILEQVEKESVIHITSHLDADGLAAAGIIGNALIRLGAFFSIRIERWIDDRVINELNKKKAPLIIFTDLGSGYLD